MLLRHAAAQLLPFILTWKRELMTVSKAHLDEADREMAATEIGLGHDYPRVAPDVIHALVQQAYRELTPAKVHSYLPVLVSRDVRARLRATTAA